MDTALSRLPGYSLSSQLSDEKENDEFMLRNAERIGEKEDCEASGRRELREILDRERRERRKTGGEVSNLFLERTKEEQRQRMRDCRRRVEAKYPDVTARFRLDDNFREYRRAWAECQRLRSRSFGRPGNWSWDTEARACRLRRNAEYPDVVKRINEWMANGEGD